MQCSTPSSSFFLSFLLISLSLSLSLSLSPLFSCIHFQISRDRALEDCIEKDSLIRQLQEEILSQAATINDCHEKLLDEERVRRTLHNSIQELKGMNTYVRITHALTHTHTHTGNIRVFCRVRPLLSGEEGFSSGGGGGGEGEVDAATAAASFNDSTVSMESVSSTTASSSHSRRHQSSVPPPPPPPSLLKLDYPDLQGDGRKLLVQYTSNEVRVHACTYPYVCMYVHIKHF